MKRNFVGLIGCFTRVLVSEGINYFPDLSCESSRVNHKEEKLSFIYGDRFCTLLAKAEIVECWGPTLHRSWVFRVRSWGFGDLKHLWMRGLGFMDLGYVM